MPTAIHRRFLLALGGALLLAPALSVPAGAQTPIVQTPGLLASLRAGATLRIGITETTPPWTFLGADNQPAGYDVAVARELAKRLGIAHVQFVTDSFANFIPSLREGKYQLVMNDLTPNPAREQQVDFARPYGVEDFRIFVRSDNRDVTGVAGLAGKRVGVTTGTTNESWARAHLTKSEIRGYGNGSLVFQDLAIGRVDAVIISHFGGLKYAKADGLPVKEVGPPLTYQLSAPALAKGHKAFLSAISQAIGQMTADGTLDRLGRKWVGNELVMSTALEKAEHEAQAASP